MTTPSFLGNLGLSIGVYEPIVRGGAYLFDVTNQIDSYSHIKEAYGGYGAASFTINGNMSQMNDWLQDGLGRHIVVNNRALKICYEGFVNKITIGAGPLTVTIGPLLDICNRVSVFYTPIIGTDPVTGKPTTGDPGPTEITENLESQARYGILEQVISHGQAVPEDAADIQATFLAENAWPVTSNEINLGGSSSSISITIDCEGYVKWLGAYIYEDITTNLFVWASTKLQDVLEADPNNIISLVYDKINYNGVLVQSYEGDNKNGLDIIQSIVEMGGASADRWLFGVYDNRKAFYYASPTTQEYIFRITEGKQVIQDINEFDVEPWDVMPGKWLIMPDFLTGKQPPADIRKDQRSIFIEKATYTAPYGLQISGSQVNTLTQKLNQMGLYSINAEVDQIQGDLASLVAYQGVSPFLDNFERTDSVVGNGWSGATWSLSGGKVSNVLDVGAEIFENPGAEAPYAAGIAQHWIQTGADLTPSEENVIIHGGASAQKIVGGTTTDVGARPNPMNITSGVWYIFNGWLHNDGPGNVKVNRQNGRIPIFHTHGTTTGYENIIEMGKAVSTGTESIYAWQDGTVSTTYYCDDWSLKSFTYSSLFLTRLYEFINVECSAAITLADVTERAGVVIKMDDPADPQNYVVAYLLRGKIYLSKVLAQVETIVAVRSCTAIAGGVIKVQCMNNSYSIIYNGVSMSSPHTIDDAAIIDNLYVGLYCNGVSTFDDFQIAPYYTVPVEEPDSRPASAWTTATYTAGNAVISLRFDDIPESDYTLLYPELLSRSLTAGFSVILNYVDMSGRLTIAQLLTMQTNGMEIMFHSRSHTIDPTSFTAFRDEAVVAGHELRSLGFDVANFVQPGTWLTDYPAGYLLRSDDDGTPPDLSLKANYWAYEAYGDFDHWGAPAPHTYDLPRTNTKYCANHDTGDAWTVAQFETQVDAVITEGVGWECLFHSSNIGLPGYISWADFLTCLDYLETKVTAGDLDILTPTQQLYATPV